jgi:hypothetical protein
MRPAPRRLNETGGEAVTQRLKITISDTEMAELKRRAELEGVPVARVAASFVGQRVSDEPARDTSASAGPALIDERDLGVNRRAPWIEPVMGDLTWRRDMWGSIVALHGRYPKALAYLREGWWTDTSHVETLCAFVVWRDWIDAAVDDPRHELAFQLQLAEFSLKLRQEGGGVTNAWKPGAPPDEWTAETPS